MTSPYEDGSPGAKICFLAEAPARAEIKMGKPLVGPSGMLFNKLLHEAGLVRADCYILNVFPYEVKKIDKGSYVAIYNQQGDLLWDARRQFSDIGLEEVQGTLERLEKCGANVIVPTGGVALSLLFGDTRIGKWRGSVLESTHPRTSGRKLVPTYHPAFILHGQFLAQYTVINDLRKVKEEAKYKAYELPNRELIIDPSFPEVIAFMKDLKRSNIFAHDIEVLNNQISCMSYAHSSDVAMCIPLLDRGRGQHRWTEEQETEIWLLHQELMADPKIKKVGHNFVFDLNFEFEQNNIVPSLENVECTMCAQGIMYPDFPKGLDFVTSIRTREPYYKDDGKLWSKPWADIERFWRYNALDSAVCLEAWLEMQDELSDGYEWTYQRTIDLFPPLIFMMTYGIRVNLEKLSRTKEDVALKMDQLKRELDSVAEYPFSPASPKQMQQYFYVTKGIKPYISRKTGRPTTDDKAMAAIYRRFQLPEAKLVQEWRTLATLHNNFLEMKVDKDGMMRCSWNPRGTTTGRLSSSETIRGTGHNMQNLPDSFRDFLEADNT